MISDPLSFLAMEEPFVHYLTTRSIIVPSHEQEPCHLIEVVDGKFVLSIGAGFKNLATKQQAAVIVREFASLFLGHHRLKSDSRSTLAKRLAVNSLMAPSYDLPNPLLPSDYDLPEQETAEFYYEHLDIVDDEEPEPEADPETIDEALREAATSFAAFCPKVSPGRLQSSYGHLLGSTIVSPGTSSVDWRVLLRNFATSSRRPGDYRPSYKRYSRRFGFPFAGKVPKRTTVAVVVDTSASNVGNFPKILAELRRLQRTADVIVYQCDTRLVERAELGRGEQFEFKGLGGTDLKPAIDQALADFGRTVVLTDGQYDGVGKRLDEGIMWVIV